VDSVLQIVLGVFRQAWVAITILMVSMAALGMLVHVLRTLGASTLGARTWVYESMAAIGTIFILLLVAFVGIPPVVQAVSASVPASPACGSLAGVSGPVSELGLFASGVLVAIVSLRMLFAFARTIGGAAVGGSTEISGAVVEAIEALAGMLLIAVIVPLVTAFFGFCN
jgi:hypothetical protein